MENFEKELKLIFESTNIAQTGTLITNRLDAVLRRRMFLLRIVPSVFYSMIAITLIWTLSIYVDFTVSNSEDILNGYLEVFQSISSRLFNN